MKLKIKKLVEDAQIPLYAHEGDAGIDIHTTENYILKPGERKMFSTGLAMEFPPGFVALVRDRSGMAAKHGITTLAGVIDCHYRGEHKIVLLNTSSESYEVKKGDRIAQLLIVPVVQAEIEEVEILEEANFSRAAKGFGSTGK